MELKYCSLARTLLIAGSLAGIALAATPSNAQNDPLAGSARVARIQGNVPSSPTGSTTGARLIPISLLPRVTASIPMSRARVSCRLSPSAPTSAPTLT